MNILMLQSVGLVMRCVGLIQIIYKLAVKIVYKTRTTKCI